MILPDNYHMLKILLVYDDFQELTNVEMMLKKIGFDVVGITSEFSLAEQLLAFNPQLVVAQGQSTKVSSSGVGKRLRESLRWDGHSVLIFYPNAKPSPADILKMRMDVGLEYPVEPTKMVQVLAQLGGLDSNHLLDKLIKNMAQDTSATSAASTATSFSERRDDSVLVSGGKRDVESGMTLKGGNAENPTFPLAPNEGEGPAKNPFELKDVQDPLLQELENLLQKKTLAPTAPPPMINDPLRAEKYNKVLGTLAPVSLSALRRREAKSRMRDMVKDISQESLRNQDDLRREFVKALFKKKG